MDISIVIVNFNTFRITCDCLSSVFASQTSRLFEVIVVDNASTDENPDNFTGLFPSVKLISNKTNHGFGMANNTGIKAASGKYVLLLNSDTIVAADTLEKCCDFLDSDFGKAQRIGVVGCRLLNPDGSTQPSVFPYLTNGIFTFLKTTNPFINLLLRLLKLDKHMSFDYSKIQPVGDISGAFMFIRADICRSTGYFDTDFFMYCEDTEWCRERIIKQCSIYYYPRTSIVHLGGKSAPTDLMYVQSLLSQSLLWYKKGWTSYIAYTIIMYMNLACDALIFPFARRQTKSDLLRSIQGKLKLFPYLFHDIPKYGRAANSRKEKLVYHGARKALSVPANSN